MSMKSDQQNSTEAFLAMRRAIDDRLVAKGMPPSSFADSVLESGEVTQADIVELKEHMEKLLAVEGRRGIWWGIATNAAFFLLGYIASNY